MIEMDKDSIENTKKKSKKQKKKNGKGKEL